MTPSVKWPVAVNGRACPTVAVAFAGVTVIASSALNVALMLVSALSRNEQGAVLHAAAWFVPSANDAKREPAGGRACSVTSELGA